MPKQTPIFTIKITESAHKKLRIHCVKTGKKLGAAATEAVNEYVKRGSGNG